MITAEQLLKEAAELKKKKSEDYQGGTWAESDYFPYKEKSYSHMLHTKYLRMRNLVDSNQKNKFWSFRRYINWYGSLCLYVCCIS